MQSINLTGKFIKSLNLESLDLQQNDKNMNIKFSLISLIDLNPVDVLKYKLHSNFGRHAFGMTSLSGVDRGRNLAGPGPS